MGSLYLFSLNYWVACVVAIICFILSIDIALLGSQGWALLWCQRAAKKVSHFLVVFWDANEYISPSLPQVLSALCSSVLLCIFLFVKDKRAGIVPNHYCRFIRYFYWYLDNKSKGILQCNMLLLSDLTYFSKLRKNIFCFQLAVSQFYSKDTFTSHLLWFMEM